MGFEFDLKGISSDPRDWWGDGVKRARDAMRETEVTFTLPEIRTPDRINLSGSGSSVEFNGNNTMLIIAAIAAAFLFFRK